MIDHYRTLRPVCPKCGTMLTTDDMNEIHHVDLWALAPDEGIDKITCPDVSCGTEFHVRGAYVPEYTTALDEDEL